MTKTSIKADLLRFVDGRPFISLTELGKALHLGKDSTRALVNDLPYLLNGKRKDFLVEDVARMLADKAQC